MAAFQEATSESHDDYRKSLLQAMCQLDPKRGADLANACLERREIHVSPRMRLLAADELLKVDARRAGDTLKEIMVTEYYRGIATNRIPPGQEKIYRNLPGGLAPHENPGFFNLVSRFMESSYPHKEDVLQSMLSMPLHDPATLMEVMRGLASLGSRGSLPRLKEMFESNKPPLTSPMFRSRCIQIIAELDPDHVCNYLKGRQAVEDNETVLRTLAHLIRDHCK
jgi:hypothetical protein